ncbi:VanW family protein [Patescibacteria group bacterium]
MAKDQQKKTKDKIVAKAVDSVKSKKKEKTKIKKSEKQSHHVSGVKKKQRFYGKSSFWIIFSWGFAAVLIAAIFIWQNIAYAEKNFLGVEIDSLNVTGKTKEETKELLEKEIEEYSETKVTLKYQDQTFKPTLRDFGLDVDQEGTIEAAFAIGRSENFLKNYWDQSLAFLGLRSQIVLSDFDLNKIDNYFFKHAKGTVEKVKNASLSFDGNDFLSVKEVDGKHFDNLLLSEQLNQAVNQLEGLEAELNLVKVEPILTIKEVNKTKLAAREILERGFTLKSVEKNVSVEQSELGNWLAFKAIKVDGNKSKYQDYLTTDPKELLKKGSSATLVVLLNRNSTKEYIESIASVVDRTPYNVRLSYSGGKLRVTQSSRTGESVEPEKTADNVEDALQEKQTEAEVAMKTESPQITEKDLNKLGIKERISTGTSDFSGSPSNRIHNIKIGAEACNGVIVSPDEIFSMNDTLGEISGATGYLKELVIKGNKIVPEYGGGLCQIATTAFRAALNSGCEITERQNHRFRVMYYEPAGTDATIYSPSPDFKFKNDTGNHILIQTSVSGNNLTFDFYGTKGGRTIKLDGPHIKAGASAGKAEEIKDPSLPKGSRQLVEAAFSGASAVLYRYVYQNGKQARKDTFNSSYVPQAAVYRVGPE